MAKIIKVIYSSPAIPQYPYDVEIGRIYECVQDKDKYFIRGKNLERVFNFEFIKRSFKPCEGYSWDMLKDKKEVINTSKRTKINKDK
jgi:hypothetical protein